MRLPPTAPLLPLLRPQLCHAHKHSGGVTVVVLTQRQKLEMEALFRCVQCGVEEEGRRPREGARAARRWWC